MEFGEIPPMLEEMDLELRTLAYEPDARQFIIGDVVAGLGDLGKLSDLIDVDNLPEATKPDFSYPVLLSLFGSPVTAPAFFTWVSSVNQGVLDDAADVIGDAFGHMMQQNIRKTSGSQPLLTPYHPLVGLSRQGHARLQTVGNCAGMSVIIHGTIVDIEEWGSGFAEYEFSNIDHLAQRISLLAGLGYMASLTVKNL
jgi:hypothetical protein